MAADDTRRDTWFERNAWAVFAAINFVFIVFGVGDIFAGGSTFESGEVVLSENRGWGSRSRSSPARSRS